MLNWNDVLTPDWPAPPNVKALVTTRLGGVSHPPYDSLNLGDHVGDNPVSVEQNRQRLNSLVPSEPLWLKQEHGTTVHDADAAPACYPTADAAVSTHHGTVLCIQTADCLPVLLVDEAGTVVGAVHAGWRGLCDGVLEATVKKMGVPGSSLLAWMGPAIGPKMFEVGDEVREAFLAADPAATFTFAPKAAGKWLADLYALARQRLASVGVTRVYGGGLCTYSDPARFYSYRRDKTTGRMASLIWLTS